MKEDTLVTIIVVMFGLVVFGFFGYLVGCSHIQQKAVDNNVAVWTVDNRGNVGFEWIKK